MPDQDQQEDFRNALSALAAQQNEMLTQQGEILKRIAEAEKRGRKDVWDRLGAIAPILSGTIIALGGAWFTVQYNNQQLRLQEVQTIEKFIPHLLGDEKSKRAAVLAISSLTDAKLAARVASIFASPGTVSALESIAENDTSTDRKALKGALARALDNMAESYRMDKRYEEAIAAYKKALSLQEQALGPKSSELVPNLNRIAEMHAIHKNYTEAEALLKRSSEIQKSVYGADSPQFAAQLRRMSILFREEGQEAKAQSLLSQAEAIEQKLPATASSGAISEAAAASVDHDREREANSNATALTTTTATDKPAHPDTTAEPRIIMVTPDQNKPEPGQKQAGTAAGPHGTTTDTAKLGEIKAEETEQSE